MSKPSLFFLAAAALLLASCSSMKTEIGAAVGQPALGQPDYLKAQQLTQTFHTDYILYLPRDYNTVPDKRWPLILFLHGAGERGTNAWTTTKHGPTKFIAKHPEFPFIMVSPQCHEDHKWNDDLVLGVLDSISATYRVDTNRVYLTGLSMGGYGTWSLATMYPERFAAVAPICGGGDKIGIILTKLSTRRSLKTLPIWAFHGGMDPTVPIEEDERMIQAMKELGDNDIKFTVYPDAGHDAWSATYDNPELYQWFLQHSLRSPP
jgi:predicted peptidase